MEASTMILATGLATQLANLWTQWVWPLMEFVIGLGLVIFVHESGHFLVAKAVGIKVERFALGFGPKLLGFQGRETEYSIRLLPLGGYIKMAGQDDFRPRQEIAEEDPRSYNAKSVGARLAVVSAGVVMNAILALVLFVVIAMVGREVPSAELGQPRKHFPASQMKLTWHQAPTTAPATQPATQPAETGLKAGDRIRRIDGQGLILSILGSEVTGFDQLAMLSIMADEDEKFSITVERDLGGRTWVGTGEIGVRMGPSNVRGGHRLSFGISPVPDPVVHRGFDYTTTETVDPFQEDDRVVSVCGQPVGDVWEIDPILRTARGTTVPITVLRKGKRVDLTVPRGLQLKARQFYLANGTKIDGEDYLLVEDDDGKLNLTNLVDGKSTTYAPDALVLARRDLILDVLGMTPPLRVTGIVPDSAAAKAKLQAGDVVAHYGDTPWPTLAQLRKVSKKATAEGTTIAVDRGGKRIESIRIVPEIEGKNALIGVCRHVDLSGTVVAGVRAGSPAARAGIESGYVIDKVNDTPVTSWLDVFDALRGLGGQEVSLTVRPSSRPNAQPKTVALGTLDQASFDADDYEMTIFPGPQLGFLGPKTVLVRKENLGEAIGYSARQTGVFIVSTYATIRSLIRKTVSTKDVMGPVGIGGHAIAAARADIMHLVYFMAYLSTILAVINFLPFPVVDGGHAAFLVLEKIRGKPLSIKVMNIIQLAGLALIALLFLAVTFQDIMRYVNG